jgi:hypothetical protein
LHFLRFSHYMLYCLHHITVYVAFDVYLAITTTTTEPERRAD